jgi:hypothetical protein
MRGDIVKLCVYVYKYMCICAVFCTCEQGGYCYIMHVCLYVCRYMYVYVYVYENERTYVCICVHLYIRMYAPTHTDIHTMHHFGMRLIQWRLIFASQKKCCMHVVQKKTIQD